MGLLSALVLLLSTSLVTASDLCESDFYDSSPEERASIHVKLNQIDLDVPDDQDWYLRISNIMGVVIVPDFKVEPNQCGEYHYEANNFKGLKNGMYLASLLNKTCKVVHTKRWSVKNSAP